MLIYIKISSQEGCFAKEAKENEEVIPVAGMAFCVQSPADLWITDFLNTGNEERTIMKRNVMRIMSLAIAGVMAAGALTACGSSNTTSTTAAAAEQTTAAGENKAADETSAEASGEKKVLKVAMECAYAPYNWTQPDDSNGAVPINDSNEYAYGYDVMMAKKICDELGYELQIVRLDWDSLIPADSLLQKNVFRQLILQNLITTQPSLPWLRTAANMLMQRV